MTLPKRVPRSTIYDRVRRGEADTYKAEPWQTWQQLTDTWRRRIAKRQKGAAWVTRCE